MMLRNIAALLLQVLLVIVRQNHAQLTAIISPRGYNASLYPETSFTFQCDVTGSDTATNIINIEWLVDGSSSAFQENRDEGVSESAITMDEATGSFRRNLSIPIGTNSRNITIILCVATAISPTGMVVGSNTSEAVIFKIQGLLDAPSNLMLSEAFNQHMRRLSWDEPFSLDITDVDPDIECYNVCYSLVNASAEKSQCTCVNQTEYTFLCVSIPLLFTVSAVNVVGEGEATSILHDGCGCTNTKVPTIVVAKEIVTLPLSELYNPSIKFLVKQLSEDSGIMTCFLVYEVKTSLLSEANTTNHGVQIPRVVQYSQLISVHLSLTVDSDLLVNELYLVTITAISADGERNISVTVEFDTYDVQSVSGRAIPGGLELNCTFAEGSQAQSCILTVCRLENGMEEYCMNLTIVRENLQQSGQLTGLQPGLYTVKNVTEVESDGSMTFLRRTIDLQLNITPTIAPIGTISDSPSVTVVGVSSSSAPVVGPIVGGVIGGVSAVIIVAILIVMIIILIRSNKNKDDLFSGNEAEAGRTKRESTAQLIDPASKAIATTSAHESSLQTVNDHPDGVSGTDQDLITKDSPTFPLYTEVMGKGKAKAGEGEAKAEEGEGSPEVPQKQLTEEDLKELNLPTAEETPTVPKQNLSAEDMQLMGLSPDSETGQETTPSSAISNKQDHDHSQSSCSPQSSEAPSKATPAAVAASGGSIGDPLYAELEHKKGKQSTITPPDMTGVQYSEIKTDEIPPRLPQKKSRKGRDHSSSSPVTSAPGSTSSLDTFKV